MPAALPIDKGQLFPTRGAARSAAETELATACRTIKNGSSSGRVTFHVVCKTCRVACVCSMRRVSSENGGGGGVSASAGAAFVVAACFARQKPSGKHATPCSSSTVPYVKHLLCDTVNK